MEATRARSPRRSGFTLLELLTVIVIIAIAGPYLKGQMPLLKRRVAHRRGEEETEC